MSGGGRLTRRGLMAGAGAVLVAGCGREKRKVKGEKVAMAFIGCGGMGASDAKTFAATGMVDVVALCDVALGTEHTAEVEALFPGARRFRDHREMFGAMGGRIEACTVATPDHSHYPIAMAAMREGVAVYVEKPMGQSFWEIGQMIEAEARTGVVCQMGNQGHSGGNYHQFRLWEEAGVFGDVRRVVGWMNGKRRWHGWEVGSLPEGGEVPEGLDWEGWLAGRAAVGYSRRLHPGGWRGWFRFGSGALGDWAPHIFDTAHRFLELGLPERVEAVRLGGQSEHLYPQASTLRFDFPARVGRGPVELWWYDGVGNLPPRPEGLEEGRELQEAGKYLEGGELSFLGGTHGDVLRVIPEAKMREVGRDLPRVAGRHSDHYQNFLLAVRGEEEARSPFSVAGPLCQVLSLGIIAQRVGGVVEFDREAGRVVGRAEVEELLQGPGGVEG